MRHFTLGWYENLGSPNLVVPNPVSPMFSPCGRWLYGRGGTFVVKWDPAGSGTEPVWEDTEFGGFLFRVIVSPCGRYLAGAEDRCVVVWDLETQREARWIHANANGDHISDIAFTPDGSHLLTACIDGYGGVQRWRAGSWRRKPAFAKRAQCDGALAVSPDGRTVATADNGGRGEKNLRIKLWDYPKGTQRKTATHGTGSIVRLEYSPGGRFLASNDEWKRVQIWDAQTLKPVAEYAPAPKGKKKVIEPVNAFAFHPSGRYLAVGGQGGAVEFVSTTTWAPEVTFDWKLGHVYGVAFSRDGTLAACGSKNGKVVVWDVDP